MLNESHAPNTNHADETLALHHHTHEQLADWAVVSFDGLILLIAQKDIIDISHFDNSTALTYDSGLLHDTEKAVTYIAPTASLMPLTKVPKNRFIVTTIKNPAGQAISWCWEKVVMLNQTQLDFIKLPELLCKKTSPLTYASRYEQEGKETLAFYADVRKLFYYCMRQAHQFEKENTAAYD